MSALPSPLLGNLPDETLHLVSHGKSGGLGCFVADVRLSLPRGTAVVIESIRGLEVGTIVGPGSGRHARLLGPALAGKLLRPLSALDADLWLEQQRLGQDIFDHARSLARRLQLPLEILDVDVLLDGSQAILQFLGAEDAGIEALADGLRAVFGCELRFENLNPTGPTAHEEEHHEAGCGKPDCGKASGGSCTTCETGGGCSSCAKGSNVDMKDYFAHLRGKMESQRVPLV